MATEWYREPGWDDDARAAFEVRLRRARPANRAQYVRIKALSLVEAGELEGGRDLLERVRRDHPDSFHAASALEHLADLARQTGDPVTAESHLRQLLDEHPTLNATTHLAELSLAEVLLERDDEACHDEVAELLTAVDERNRGRWLHSGRFRWHVAMARLADQAGEPELRRSSASAALDCVGAEPQLPRHPTVGLVSADPDTLRWLRGAADEGVGPDELPAQDASDRRDPLDAPNGRLRWWLGRLGRRG